MVFFVGINVISGVSLGDSLVNNCLIISFIFVDAFAKQSSLDIINLNTTRKRRSFNWRRHKNLHENDVKSAHMKSNDLLKAAPSK